jgi:transcriptional regulator GlxA family with amidase domain
VLYALGEAADTATMLATTRSPVRVAVLAFDDCLSSAVVGLLDSFQLANRWSAETSRASKPEPRFAVRIVAARATIVGSSGVTFASEPFEACGRVDIAIVPPIFGEVESTLSANSAITTWLTRSAQRGGVAASVCTGAFFLAAAGLLAGRRATTNPLFAPAFRRAHPDTTLMLERRLVDEGRVLTAGSTTAFLDLAVYLIERFAGHDVAVLTAKALNIDKNHRSQLPHFLPFADKSHGDAAVLGLQAWLEEHLIEPVQIEHLARRGGMSQRSLNRRFRSATGHTPLEYLHRLRVEVAKHHLETTDLNVQDITLRVGYHDARSFSRLFRERTGLSPREYRVRFAAYRPERLR